MATILNKTPHDVVMYNSNGDVVKTYKTTGEHVRVSVKATKVDSIDGFDVMGNEFGEMEVVDNVTKKVIGNDLPKLWNTYYIVSVMVLTAYPERDDFIRPDSGSTAIRDEKNQIKGVLGFCRN